MFRLALLVLTLRLAGTEVFICPYTPKELLISSYELTPEVYNWES